jgi:hypothetical protein
MRHWPFPLVLPTAHPVCIPVSGSDWSHLVPVKTGPRQCCWTNLVYVSLNAACFAAKARSNTSWIRHLRNYATITSSGQPKCTCGRWAPRSAIQKLGPWKEKGSLGIRKRRRQDRNFGELDKAGETQSQADHAERRRVLSYLEAPRGADLKCRNSRGPIVLIIIW